MSQLTHVLHTHPVTITSVAGGNLHVEPYCIPDLDCRIVGVLVYHCCTAGAIHSWDDEVIKHVYQVGSDTCIKLDCWSLSPPCTTEEPDICWQPDPCKRLDDLRCCEYEWLKLGRKTSWSFRDSAGSSSYLSESRLVSLINQAEAECEAAKTCGTNSRCITFRC